MVDPKRLESPLHDEGADRNSQIEALLVQGLDRYFAGRYEDAIHLWTRVLFLDRSHARARAYIDRARTALGERQRRTDEMLEAGRDLLNRGQTAAARDLLTEIVATSGDDEQASALRVRIERFERVYASTGALASNEADAVEAVPGWTWREPGRLVRASLRWAGAAVILTGLGWLALQDWRDDRRASEALPVSTAVARLPVLSSSEVALVRAHTLFDRGRLAEALRALDRVPAESPDRPAADELRIEIQQLLLASGRQPASGGRVAESIRR